MVNTREFIQLVHKSVPAEDFLRIVPEKCNGCKNCVIVCPSILWRMRERKAGLAPDYKSKCLECGACWQVCEPGAIEFDFPRAGTGVIVKYG